MYARLCPDSSGAWKLDPKFRVAKDRILTFSTTKQAEARFETVFTPADEQGLAILLGDSLYSDFSKRRNVTFVAYGTSGTGKTYTCDSLIPQFLASMKPTFQFAEQCALEQAGDKVREKVEEPTLKVAPPKAELPSSEPSPRRVKQKAHSLPHNGILGAQESPRIVVARRSESKGKDSSQKQGRPLPFMTSIISQKGEESKKLTSPRNNKPGVTTISNNGRRGMCEVLYFGDTDSLVVLPPIPGLSSAMGKLSVEMYIMSDCKHSATLFKMVDTKSFGATLSIELNQNENHEYEDGSTIIFIRDMNRREIVAKATRDILDNKWHHIRLNIIDMANNKIQFLVDGTPAQLSACVTGSPMNFADWESTLWIGVGASFIRREEDFDVTEKHYKGAVADLWIWDTSGESAQILAHYPLDERNGNELKDRGMHKLSATSHNVQWKQLDFPELGLYFNGRDSYINVGCLGDFGKYVGNCAIEFWFRTNHVQDTMSIFHVTDSLKKQACLSIEMNTNAELQYVKGQTTFYVRDSKGNAFSGTTNLDIYDDRWYNLVWKISCNANSSQMTVNINGVRIELPIITHQNPHAFGPFSQWCCIGAANRKGRKVSNFFKGSIKDFKISHSGHMPVAQWPMNEGIGCRILMDTTGNGNNGTPRIGNTTGCTWLAMELPFSVDTKEDELRGEFDNEKKWENNDIKLAYIQMYSFPNEKGIYGEMLYDCLADKKFNALEEMTWKSARSSADGEQKILAIPKVCFRETTSETIQELYELGRSRRSARRGHGIVTIQLGDSHISFIDLAGCSYASRSAFDPPTFTWTTPVTNFGADEKAKACVNRSHNLFEHCLLEIGHNPQLLKRSMTCHDVSKPIFSNSLITQLMHYSLFNGDEPSKMYLVIHVSVEPAHQEAVSIMELNHRMCDRTHYFASVVIQKSIRGHLQRKKCNGMKDVREKERARMRRVVDLIRRFPKETSTKHEWRAVLIGITTYKDSRLNKLSHPIFDCWELGEILIQLGYQVTLMLEECPEEFRPTRKNIIRVLKDAASQDSQLFVYVSGYGQKGFFYTGPNKQDLKEEYEQYVEQQEQLRKQIEEEARLRAEEEEKRRIEEEEAEKKRQEEEEAAKEKNKRGRRGFTPRTPRTQEPKEEKKVPSPTVKPKGKKPGTKKKEKTQEKEEEIRKQREKDEAEEKQRKEAEEQAQALEKANKLEAEKKAKEDRKRQVSEANRTPTLFVLCKDSPMEFDSESVLTFEFLRSLITSEQQPQLGQHTWLVIDAVPWGQPMWWHTTEEEQEIGAQSGIPRRILPSLPPQTAATYFEIFDATHTHMEAAGPSEHNGWGSFFLKKALLGWAQVRQRKNATEAENNRVSFESLRAFMKRKLAKRDNTVTILDSNEYVGEFNPANTIIVQPLSRKDSKRSSKKVKAMFTIQFAVNESFDLASASCLEGLLHTLQTLATTSGDSPDQIEVKKWEVHNFVSLFYSGNLLEASIEQFEPQWNKDLKKYMTPDIYSKSKVTFEVGMPNSFSRKITFQDDPVTPLSVSRTDSRVSVFDNRTAQDTLKFTLGTLELLRTRYSSFPTMSVFNTQGFRQYISCRCVSSSFVVRIIEKLFRSGGVLSPHCTITSMERFTEQQMVHVEEEDRHHAEEEKKRQDELNRKRLLEIETRKKEEERLKQELRIRDEILKKLAELRSALPAIKITEDDILFLFQLTNKDIFCEILTLFTTIVEENTASVKLVRLGVVEFVCKGLVAHSSEVLVLKAVSLFLHGALNSRKTPKDEDAGEEIRKSMLKYGGVAALLDSARHFMNEDAIMKLILTVLSPLCESEIRNAITTKGGIDIFMNVLRFHAANLELVALAIWGSTGICARCSEVERNFLMDQVQIHIKSSDINVLHRCVGLVVALMESDEKLKELIIHGNLVSVIFHVMQTHPGQYDINRACLYFIEELLENESARGDAVAKGVVPLLQHSAKTYASNAAHVVAILEILSLLADVPQVKESKLDVMFMCKYVMQAHPDDEGIQEAGALILQNLNV